MVNFLLGKGPIFHFHEFPCLNTSWGQSRNIGKLDIINIQEENTPLADITLLI